MIERGGLQGRLILVTRPLPEAEDFCQLIDSRYGRSLLAPALEIHPPRDPLPLQNALANCARYQGIIITSANGARVLLNRVSKGDERIKASLPALFAVGEKSARPLREAGYDVAVPAQPGGGRELAHAIRLWRPGGGRFLFLRAEKGRDELVTLLHESGFQIDRVIAYRAEPAPSIPETVKAALAAGEVDAIPFFSAQTTIAFWNALPPEGVAWLQKPVLIAISETMVQSLAKIPIRFDLIAARNSAEGMLDSLGEYWKNPLDRRGA